MVGPIEGGVTKGETGESGSIVCAPLPGAIVEMRVAHGDRIVTGATVATIESMKMVHSLSVWKVFCLRVDCGSRILLSAIEQARATLLSGMSGNLMLVLGEWIRMCVR